MAVNQFFIDSGLSFFYHLWYRSFSIKYLLSQFCFIVNSSTSLALSSFHFIFHCRRAWPYYRFLSSSFLSSSCMQPYMWKRSRLKRISSFSGSVDDTLTCATFSSFCSFRRLTSFYSVSSCKMRGFLLILTYIFFHYHYDFIQKLILFIPLKKNPYHDDIFRPKILLFILWYISC